jgi:sRNA-binding protein
VKTIAAAVQTVPLPTPAKVERGAAVVAPTPPVQQSKREAAAEEKYQLLCVLNERFPAAFVRDWDTPVSPLAIGTRQMVEALLPDVPAPAIGRAIGLHIAITRADYLTAIIEGRPRVDLYGAPVAEPTAEEREIARQQLTQWRERWREKKRQRLGQGGAPTRQQKAGKVAQSVRHDSAGA